MENSNIKNAESQNLLTEWAEVLDAKGDYVKPLKSTRDRVNMASILENTHGFIMTEGNNTSSGDLGIFRPIIMPVARRIAPNLLANQVVGVQPLSGPTGQAFAWRVGYSGNNYQRNAAGSAGSALQLSKLDRGDTASSKSGHTALSVIVTVVDDVTAGELPALIRTAWNTHVAANYSQATDVQLHNENNTAGQAGGTEFGLIRFLETTNGFLKMLVEYQLTSGNPQNAIASSTALYLQSDATDKTKNAADVINNEMLFNSVLTEYAGPVTTAAGEALADDMPTIKGSLESVTVTAKTRKLKAEYTIEMAQDLKAVHNIDAEAELMNSIQTEIAAEIDRELVDAMRDNSNSGGSWIYGNVGTPINGTTANTHADGRDEIMKFRTLYTKITHEGNRIARDTRKGAGNFIICSINVLTALEALNNFTYSSVQSDIGQLGSFTNVGNLDGRYQVYVDTLYWRPATEPKDYVLVGYKGPTNFDSGVVYLPYIPVMLQKTIHEQSFQPVIGAMTRSAIMYSMNGTNNFYRNIGVNFAGSQLDSI